MHCIKEQCIYWPQITHSHLTGFYHCTDFWIYAVCPWPWPWTCPLCPWLHHCPLGVKPLYLRNVTCLSNKTRAVLSPGYRAKPCKFRYVKSVRTSCKSCAIAKTAQCALYVGALKIFGAPWLRPRLLFLTFFMGFCSDPPYECSSYKIWSP